MSERKRVSSLSFEAYWMSSNAFQPMARTAKLSMPKAVGRGDRAEAVGDVKGEAIVASALEVRA
jgi:hypothetical protein